MSLVDRQYESTWAGPHGALAETAPMKSPVRVASGESADRAERRGRTPPPATIRRPEGARLAKTEKRSNEPK